MLIFLPTELVEEIASYLDIASIRFLRVVHSSLDQKLLRHFKERFFRKLTIRWNLEDLEKLVGVVSHPHLGTALQHLVIDATPHYAMRLWKIRTRIVTRDTVEQNMDFRSPHHSEYAEIKERGEEAARFWNETRHDQKTLTTLFGKMHVLQSITFSYDGMDRSHGKFGRRYCETSQNEMSLPFVSTMAAIATSGIVVRQILVHEEKGYGAVSIGRIESLSPLLSKFSAVLQNLTILKLDLRDWRTPDEGFEPPIGRAPFIVRFLSKCTALHALRLSAYSNFEPELFAEIAKHCSYPFLESCELELFEIRALCDLFKFLDPAKTRLRTLSLSCIKSHDVRTKWPDVLRRIALDYTLSNLTLKNNFDMIGCRIGFGDIGYESSITLQSPGLQSALLQYTDQLHLTTFGPPWRNAAVAYPFIGLGA
ncbi:hypothetical protein BDV95DRAFT_572425 [Massariosphaeria phaeospora]|uniref:F-box domain-containing protein n=1 Tax=Massariosphaeria phaeospora TaxID=100035 RepID=A0A7C8M9W0_9PLEO|nr:hypothetical protein BDV95DRAFT_572425 [Massariosphaeria phaeospora]